MTGDNGGSGTGGGLSKLGTALTIIFVISLLALFAELFYVLWRRKLFFNQTNTTPTTTNTDHLAQNSQSDSNFSPIASSKELLYFFCVRPNSQSDQNSVNSSNNPPINGLDSNNQSEIEVIDLDLMKIGGMFGPPRFLFTIKEEEREDVDSPSDEKVKKEKSEGKIGINRVSLEDCLMEADEEAVVVVEIEDCDDTTPFSTPCASPLYFTPSASPAHEVVVNFPVSEEGGVFSEV